MITARENLRFVFTAPSFPEIWRSTFSKIFQKGKTNDANTNFFLKTFARIRLIRGLIPSVHFALYGELRFMHSHMVDDRNPRRTDRDFRAWKSDSRNPFHLGLAAIAASLSESRLGKARPKLYACKSATVPPNRMAL
jgi:hypothetical protein